MNRLDEELAVLDATAQAELVRRKQMKPIELVDAAIERIERVNPQINAVVTPMFEEARRVASGPLPVGPFTGVPFLLKDLMAAYAGVPTMSGAAFLRDYVPAEDSELVRRHKHAGLIVLGKTNTPEFGLVPTTEPSLHGPTRNPWDLERSAGGSSGGAAAAVAARLVPVAHASDGGGSIRIPASCCGVFGLKPTRGRIPGAFEPTGTAVDHAVSRSVRDSAAMLDATCGAERGAWYQAPPPARPFVEEVGADPGRLHVGFTTRTLAGGPVHADCAAAVTDAAALCRDLGHEVEEASLPIPGELFTDMFVTVWYALAAISVDGMAMLTGRTPTADQFEVLTWAMAEQGRASSAEQYLMAMTMLQQMSQGIAGFFETYDVWITPMLTEPPVPLGTFISPPEDPMRGFDRAREYVPHTYMCNVTGQPAMSVPLWWNEQGLPVGTHFAGRFGDEATLLRLAGQLEQARPWADRRPPVSA